MKKPAPKKKDSPLRAEVSPAALAVLIGVLVVLFGGYFLYQNGHGPKFLHGNGGAAASQAAQAQHLHIDEVTGRQVTHD